MAGDERYGCRTMPIAWGVNATRVYIAVWLAILISMLVIIQVYILQFQWWWPVAYSIVMIIVPLLFVFWTLVKARSVNEYHQLSNMLKLIMLTGILSMIFFYFYL